MKKILLIALCVAMMVSLVCCSATDDSTSSYVESKISEASSNISKEIKYYYRSGCVLGRGTFEDSEKYDEIKLLFDSFQLGEQTESMSEYTDGTPNYDSYSMYAGDTGGSIMIVYEENVEYRNSECRLVCNGNYYEISNLEEVREEIFSLIDYIKDKDLNG